MRMISRYILTSIQLRLHRSYFVYLPVLRMSRTGWPKTVFTSILQRRNLSGSGRLVVFNSVPMTPLVIAGALIQPSSHVRNLGVILDSDLSMTTHINKLAAVCFFHIRQLRLIRRSVDNDAAHALVRALIHSRLDYCNGVLAGLSLEKYRRLQSILKASARLVLQLPSYASVTQLMHDRLHWLDVPQRIKYKLCVCDLQMHSQICSWISVEALYICVISPWSVSTNDLQLLVNLWFHFQKLKLSGTKGSLSPVPRLGTVCHRSFMIKPCLCRLFKKHLKTHLFRTQ